MRVRYYSFFFLHKHMKNARIRSRVLRMYKNVINLLKFVLFFKGSRSTLLFVLQNLIQYLIKNKLSILTTFGPRGEVLSLSMHCRLQLWQHVFEKLMESPPIMFRNFWPISAKFDKNSYSKYLILLTFNCKSRPWRTIRRLYRQENPIIHSQKSTLEVSYLLRLKYQKVSKNHMLPIKVWVWIKISEYFAIYYLLALLPPRLFLVNGTF